MCDCLLSKELLTEQLDAHVMCVGCMQITVCEGWFVCVCVCSVVQPFCQVEGWH